MVVESVTETVPPNWDVATLGDVLELKRGYDLPKRERQAGSVPVVSSSGISGSHSEARIEGPGVVTGRYGTIGEVFFIEQDFWPLNTTLYVRDFKGSDARFVSYFLKTLDYLSFSDKAAVPGVNRNHLHQAKVLWPPLNDQKRIAHILATLDDKIDLNRRMNATLDAIARALFKSWFMDFDPVKARAEGRRPLGLDPETAALFPDSFTDSPLGPIPEGWAVGTIGHICSVAVGGDWGKDLSFDGSIQAVCLRGVDLERLRRDGSASPPWRWIKSASLAKRVISTNDVLIAASGVGPLGRPLWASKSLLNAFSLPVVYSNFCKRLTASSPPHALYLDRVLHELRDSGDVWEYATGTSLPNLDVAGLLSRNLVIPAKEVLEQFYSTVVPITDKLFSGESATLAAIRDALLPRLLSGEIHVGQAERIAEEVA